MSLSGLLGAGQQEIFVFRASCCCPKNIEHTSIAVVTSSVMGWQCISSTESEGRFKRKSKNLAFWY